jgi:hypothetical protein
MFPFISTKEKHMSKIGILGATALSLSLALAAPAFARNGGMGGGMHAGGMGGSGFRSAQASAQPRMGAANFAGPNRGQFASPGRAQFTQGNTRVAGNWQPGYNHRGFDRRVGFGAGGVALGYGLGYDDGYYDPGYDGYYGDNYATSDDGDAAYPVQQGFVAPGVSGDASYCAQRYRSYDPASNTYLGLDGMRHVCS